MLKLKSLFTPPFQPPKLFKYFSSIHHHDHQLFDKTPKPPLIYIHQSMLNALRNNNKSTAFNIFKTQLQMGPSEIDEVAIALAAKACRGDPKLGSQIHAFTISTGFNYYLTVSNSLMNMYSKSGQFDVAFYIFKNLENPDTVSYNTVLSGFVNGEAALSFAREMHLNGVVFDAVSYTMVLAHCADNESFKFGVQLHCNVLKFGLNKEVFVGNALVTLYSKWGRIIESEKVFDEMPTKDLVTWNALISGYAQDGSYGTKAMLVLKEMIREELNLDHVSFTSAISACGHEKKLITGKQIHGLAIKHGYNTHVSVCNVLVSMYIKCEIVNDAKLVFENMSDRNVISWTTMISVDEENAVKLFNYMRREEVYPNDVTFVGLIHAITSKTMILEGLMVHSYCIKTSFISELNVANCFITMYAKFNSMQDSFKVFNELNYLEIISWNSIISGYTQNGMYHEAIETFLLAIIQTPVTSPNEYTFGSVLSAIASSESISLKQGQRCHSYILKLGLNFNPIVSGALLDMYAKRGSINESEKVFLEIKNPSQVVYTAIISAYTRHGNYELVMLLFNKMIQNEIKPDSITFLSVLTACGREGMVDMGVKLFNMMVNIYLIEPSSEHFSSMVDMLGRVGRLKEAEELMDLIPGKPGITVLQSLLGSSKLYGNVEIAKRVSDILVEMEPNESGSYVLMSNLFAEKGQWEKVADIRKGMRDKGVKKEVGFSWVDVGSLSLHGFSSGDTSHPQYLDIYMMAESLGLETRFLEKERGQRNDEFKFFEISV